MFSRSLLAGVAGAGAVLLCCSSFGVNDVDRAPDSGAIEDAAPDAGPTSDAAAPAPRIYVIGGQSSAGVVTDILAATVLDSGELGAWEKVGALPTEISGMAAGGGRDTLLVAGGNWPDRSTTTPSSLAFERKAGALFAFPPTHPFSNRFLPSGVVVGGRFYMTGGYGSLDGGEVISTDLTTAPIWRSEPSMPDTRYDHGLAVSGDVVFAGGGRAPTDDAGGNELPLATVVVTKVRPDGTLSPWTPGNPLPYAVYAHSLVTYAGSLYLVGGQNDLEPELSANGLVRSAPIGPDGALGAWGVVADIPGGRHAAHAAVVVGEHLFVIGGIVTTATAVGGQSAMTATVWSAHFNGRGGVDAWVTTTSLPVPRAYEAAVAF